MQLEESSGYNFKFTMDVFEDKCLGLPVLEGKMKVGKFQSTKEKVLKRLSDWIKKYASCGAKEDLINQSFRPYLCIICEYSNFRLSFVRSYPRLLGIFCEEMRKIEGEHIG